MGVCSLWAPRGINPVNQVAVTPRGRCRLMAGRRGNLCKQKKAQIHVDPQPHTNSTHPSCRARVRDGGTVSGSLRLPVRLRTSLCLTEILPPSSRWRPDESTAAHSTQVAHTVRRNAHRRAQACILTAGRCAGRAAKSSACTGHATVSGCVWQQGTHLGPQGHKRLLREEQRR